MARNRLRVRRLAFRPYGQQKKAGQTRKRDTDRLDNRSGRRFDCVDGVAVMNCANLEGIVPSLPQDGRGRNLRLCVASALRRVGVEPLALILDNRLIVKDQG